jgi:hypothetical protein
MPKLTVWLPHADDEACLRSLAGHLKCTVQRGRGAGTDPSISAMLVLLTDLYRAEPERLVAALQSSHEASAEPVC